MKVLVPLAEGFEEIETAAIVDILRRAYIDVTLAGLVSSIVEGAHGIKIVADKKISDIDPENFDAIILPGGNPGYINLSNSSTILKIVKDFDQKKKIIGAICGAPLVLVKAGILNNRIATCYPGLEKKLPKPREGKVVIDNNIITSKSPGTAIEFALKIVEIISGKNKAEKIREELAV
jgi:4-methyl-5(b-hydroxyethyl)-thiazole monophosphate biosynthesis